MPQRIHAINSPIFLAVPYSNPHAAVRNLRAEKTAEVAYYCLQENIPVYSPICHWHYVMQVENMLEHPDNVDYKKFRLQSEAMLDVCRSFVIYTLDGWQDSIGVEREFRYWKKRHDTSIYLGWWQDTEFVVSDRINRGFKYVPLPDRKV